MSLYESNDADCQKLDSNLSLRGRILIRSILAIPLIFVISSIAMCLTEGVWLSDQDKTLIYNIIIISVGIFHLVNPLIISGLIYASLWAVSIGSTVLKINYVYSPDTEHFIVPVMVGNIMPSFSAILLMQLIFITIVIATSVINKRSYVKK